MIRTYLLDDHPIIHSAVREVLSHQTDISIVGGQLDPNIALQEIPHLILDVIILDVFLKGWNGFDVLKQLRELSPDVKVLFFSMNEEDLYAVRLLNAGANGYVYKGAPPEALVDGIRAVANNGRYVSEKLRDVEFRLMDSHSVDVHERLSAREYSVFLLVASGCRVKDICDRLSLANTTVHTYIFRIKEKTGLDTTEEMNFYARNRGLL